jgi:hypothetical protein
MKFKIPVITVGAVLLLLFRTAVGQPTRGEALCGTSVLADDELVHRAWLKTLAAHPGLREVLQKESFGAPTAAAQIGDQHVFWTYNFVSESFDTTRAELRAIGAMSYVWVAVSELTSSPEPHVTQAEVDSILSALEERTPAASRNPSKGILELAREYYGNPPNVDGNFVKGGGDGKTHFLIYDIKDGWNGSGAFYAGYFYRVDVDPGTSSVAFSNRRDMLYIDSYPGIYLNGTRNPQRPLSTLAHEFQHLIHWNYDPWEISFFNEGLSEYAEYLCGYGLRSPSLYFSNPNTALLSWSQELADYSRAALWTLYLAEQYGEGFTRQLTQNPLSGASGFDNAAFLSGLEVNLRSTVANFLVANILQDRSVDAAYGYVDLGAVGGKPRLAGDYFGARGSLNQSSLQAYASDYLRFRALDTLRLRISLTTGSPVGTLIQYADVGATVSSVSAGSDRLFDFTGSDRAEAILSVRNDASSGTASYVLEASGRSRTSSVLELALDDGRTQTSPNNLFRQNDTAFVVFTGVEGGRVDSVRLWFQTQGSARLLVRKVNRAFSLETNLLTGLGAASLMGSQPVSFSVADTSFLATRVDLRSFNISSAEDFVVQVIYGAGAPNPLLRRDSAQGTLSSYLSLSSQPTAGRTMYASTGDFYVRAYLSPVDDSLPPPPVVPEAFALHQNFPNPFPAAGGSSSTEIWFDLPRPVSVLLSVYDALGRQVAVLANGERPAGRQTVTLSATCLASGVYFYRLVTPDFVATRKMVVVR